MRKALATLALAVLGFAASAQQNVGINTTPASSAALDVGFPTGAPKGVLVPRVTTTERNVISSPAKGLMVYDSTLNNFYYHNGTGWSAVGGGPSLQLFATSTQAQTRAPYAYSRHTFNYNNVVSGATQSAWTGNNTYTVPAGQGGLYNINLAIILTGIGSFASYSVLPEIQITRGSSSTYYYGVGSQYSPLLSGNQTDATSANSSAAGQAPLSYSRGILNVSLPLQAGDVLQVFYRGNASSTSASQTVSFSTDGSTYLSIVKLN